MNEGIKKDGFHFSRYLPLHFTFDIFGQYWFAGAAVTKCDFWADTRQSMTIVFRVSFRHVTYQAAKMWSLPLHIFENHRKRVIMLFDQSPVPSQIYFKSTSIQDWGGFLFFFSFFIYQHPHLLQNQVPPGNIPTFSSLHECPSATLMDAPGRSDVLARKSSHTWFYIFSCVWNSFSNWASILSCYLWSFGGTLTRTK